MRGVALVATDTLEHGDELFLNYLDDKRVSPEAINDAPDWLLSPPETSKYLEKKEYITELPFFVKVLMHIQERKMGRSYERFDSRTDIELPEP